MKNISKKNTDDISIDALKKLVKVCGDGCVTGIVRFKKIKPCKGYEDADKKATLRLSKIKAGRPLEDDSYAAVIRFRFIFFIIPFLGFLLFMILLKTNTGAKVREGEITEEISIVQTEADIEKDRSETEPEIETEAGSEADLGTEPEMGTEPEVETEPETETEEETPFGYDNMLITVPGITEAQVNMDKPEVCVYNPVSNKCLIRYIFFNNGMIKAESALLRPGEDCSVNLYEKFGPGKFLVDVLTEAYSLDEDLKFNSVHQEMILKVY